MKKHILIIDDEIAQLKLATRLLSSLGYTVDCVATGRSGAALALVAGTTAPPKIDNPARSSAARTGATLPSRVRHVRGRLLDERW